MRPYATATALYNNTTAIGTIGGFPVINNYTVAEGVAGSQEVYAFVDQSNNAYYVWENAISSNFPTFSGDTHTNTVIDNIASTTGLYPGQIITGTGIQAGTRIATITSATAITTTIATTASATITITKEAVAKIIDADFPSDAVSMAYLDGRFFAGATSGRIYQSALNDPSSWAASEYLTADYGGDDLAFIFKQGAYIVAAGTGNTIQYFYNAGNAFGSVLSAQEELTITNLKLLCSKMEIDGESYVLVGTSSSMTNLYKLTGANQYTRVSDDFWGNIICTNSMTSLASAVLGKKTFIVLKGGSNGNVIYDPAANQFSMFDTVLSSSSGGKFTKSGQTTTFIWAVGNTWQDSTVAYTMTIQTEPKVLNGGRGFTVNAVTLLADTQASGTTALLTSKDDTANYVSKGSFTMTANQKVVRRCGFYDNSCSFRLTNADNTGWRGQAIVVDWEPAVT